MAQHYPCGHWHKGPSSEVGDDTDNDGQHGTSLVYVPIIDMSLGEGDQSYIFWSEISFGPWAYYSAGDGGDPERISDDFDDDGIAVELRDIEMQYIIPDEEGPL